MKDQKTQLTLGPLLFHWDAEKRRDFYFRIADEAPVERVYLGEVVCSKRASFFEPYVDEVVKRLEKAGKEVVRSTMSLVTTQREIDFVKAACDAGALIEANDVSTVRALSGKPFVIGPFVNVFNEGALDFLVRQGASRLVMSMELRQKAMEVLARYNKKLETEVMVFGRQPLTVSMRCYAARAYGLHKDGCQFACGRDPDGLGADTVTGQKLLTINGTEVMSHGYVVLMSEIAALQHAGVGALRLSPQAMDMVAVACIFRDVLDGKTAAAAGVEQLRALTDVPFINGYARGIEGMTWAEAV